MTEGARRRILGRLRRAVFVPGAVRAAETPTAPNRLSPDQKVRRLKQLMEAVRAEVHLADATGWTDVLKQILRLKKIRSLLYAPRTDIGSAIAAAWQSDAGGLPVLRPYDQKIDAFKEALFGIDAAVTGTEGAVADTGALILWPGPAEPRLMSLVPPIHIAVLRASRIYDTFSDAIAGENWAARMPTNALLISGPSKTADIEMTLAFGVHGPKELIVLIIEDRRT